MIAENKRITYQGYEVSHICKRIFPHCAVAMRRTEDYGYPNVEVFVREHYSVIMLSMAHKWLIEKLSSPIFDETGGVPFLINIYVGQEKDWLPDGYTEFEGDELIHPPIIDTLEEIHDMQISRFGGFVDDIDDDFDWNELLDNDM